MRMRSIPSALALSGLFAVLTAATTASAAEYPIAGTTPSERPAGAPTITTVEKDQAWYAHALSGVTKPYPPSLSFLEDQGNWHTPFNRPGMPAPYDIRGWHNAK